MPEIKMNKLLLTAAIVVLPLFSTMPAFAMKGIDAARSCNANPKCTLLLDDAGGATILIGDHIIDCNSPQEECVVVQRTGKPITITGGGATRPTAILR
jgi:hypothetical protein